MSGFWRTAPPVDEVPRRDRRAVGVEEHAARTVGREPLGQLGAGEGAGNGPAGLGGSPGSRSNGSGSAAGAAAVLNASAAAEWPRVTPGVAYALSPSAESSKRPPSADELEVRSSPGNFTTASRRPAPPRRVEPLVRVLVAVLHVLGELDDVARRVEQVQVVVVAATRPAGRPRTASRARCRSTSDRSDRRSGRRARGRSRARRRRTCRRRGRSRRSRPPSCPTCRRRRCPRCPRS